VAHGKKRRFKMAVTTTVPNRFKLALQKGEVNLLTDTCKIILMAPGFVFNKDTMGTYASVSASEVANGFGYTTGGATLSGMATSQDDTNNLGKTTWSNASWTASGANVSAAAAIVYDDTHTDNLIVMCIDFGGTQTVLDGYPGVIAGLELDTTD
jgi:hypothetical protein